ncbi:zinc ribbon-containing (seleno)protein DG [Desulfocastanea catecholica]
MFLKFFGKKSEKNSRSRADQAAVVDGIDQEMNYCPLCKAEYRADIRHCGTCDVPLINGREKLAQVREKQQALAKRSMQILPTDELVNIRKGPLKDMKTLQRVLAQERVPALLATGEEGCAKGCCGPELYLQIKKEDLPLALEILARDFIKSTALDSHDLLNAAAVFDQLAAETVCPACGCRFSPTVGACPECGLCFE